MIPLILKNDPTVQTMIFKCLMDSINEPRKE